MTVLDTELPFMATIGIDNALSITVSDDDGNPLEATAGTLKVYDGSTLLEEPSVAFGTPLQTATLLAASTADRGTSTRFLMVWLLTIAGVQKPYIQSGYLVNNQLYPVLTDKMLTDRLPHLSAILGNVQAVPGQPNTLKDWRVSVWNELQRWLIKKGKRLDLALDQWAFVDMHRYWTLESISAYLHTSTGDIDWLEKRDDDRRLRIGEQDTLNLRWDSDSSGTANEEEKEPTQGTVWFNAPRGR